MTDHLGQSGGRIELDDWARMASLALAAEGQELAVNLRWDGECWTAKFAALTKSCEHGPRERARYPEAAVHALLRKAGV